MNAKLRIAALDMEVIFRQASEKVDNPKQMLEYADHWRERADFYGRHKDWSFFLSLILLPLYIHKEIKFIKEYKELNKKHNDLSKKWEGL